MNLLSSFQFVQKVIETGIIILLKLLDEHANRFSYITRIFKIKIIDEYVSFGKILLSIDFSNK